MKPNQDLLRHEFIGSHSKPQSFKHPTRKQVWWSLLLKFFQGLRFHKMTLYSQNIRDLQRFFIEFCFIAIPKTVVNLDNFTIQSQI